MNTRDAEDQSNITREDILKIVGLRFGSSIENPNPDEPEKPGPWGPIIREALDYTEVFGPFPEPWRQTYEHVSGPHPQPWKQRFNADQILRIVARRFPQIWEVVGGGHSFDEVALNPQPLPPHEAFAEALAQAIIRRAELVRDVAASLGSDQIAERGIIVVGGRDLSAMIDEFCGNNFRLVRPKPHPPWWKDSFGSWSYLVMATQFDRAAHETSYDDLRDAYHEAAGKLVDTGLAKLR